MIPALMKRRLFPMLCYSLNDVVRDGIGTRGLLCAKLAAPYSVAKV